MRSALAKLLNNLPPPADAGLVGDPDSRARATLAMFVQTALGATLDSNPVPEDPVRCPNCDKSMVGQSSPYCSKDCREQAGFVRQFRRNLHDGTAFDEARQAALGQVMWYILGGGYPRRNALVPERVQRKLLAQPCAKCGAPSVTFDHRGSACNRPSNLEPFCRECAITREFGDEEFLARPAVNLLLQELASRVASPSPLRACDDPDTWNWRTFVQLRKDLAGASRYAGFGP